MRNYSLRFSLLPTVDFSERVGFLLDFCEKALIDDVMFFISPEEVNTGHVTLDEAKKYTDVILRAKKILSDRGITISLNPWVTLGHWDGGRKLKENQNFDLMVDADGTVGDRIVCPLSKSWRDYYVELLNFFVQILQPRIIWFEDDMRYSNHLPVKHGCFCEEHMKRYNAKLGTNYDRETFVKKIFTDNLVRKAYLDVLGESIKETLEYIIERVPNQCAFGLMTGGPGFNEGRKYREIFSAMSENGKREKPSNRICLHSYRQRGLQSYAWAINQTSMLSRKVSGNFASCVSEMESYPHSMYTKSAKYFKYQLLSTSAMGLDGDTFSIFEFNGNGAINYDKYAIVMRTIKPYLSRLTKTGLTPDCMMGVKVLYSENSSYSVTAKEGSFSSLSPNDGWLYAYLTGLGIACSYTSDSSTKRDVVALSGEVLRNYDEIQITKLFERNFVILTADNIDVLKEKNLLHLIDVEDYEVFPELSGVNSMEEMALNKRVMGIKKLRATAQFFCGDYYRIKYGNNLSKMVYTNMLDYNQKVSGVGICQVKNALIIPYKNVISDQGVPISMLCPLREYVIKHSIFNNSIYRNQLFMVYEENVCIYAFDKEEKVYLVIMNFSDDDYKRIHFDTPYLFDNIKYFTPDNETPRQASFICENGKYTINQTLKGMESYVLACKKNTTGRFFN